MCVCVCVSSVSVFVSLAAACAVCISCFRPLSNCILNQLSNHVAVGWQTHLFSSKRAHTHTLTHKDTALSLHVPRCNSHSRSLTHKHTHTLKCKSKCKSSPNFAFVSHHFPTQFFLLLSLSPLHKLSNCQQCSKLSLFSVYWEVFQLILMCEN